MFEYATTLEHVVSSDDGSNDVIDAVGLNPLNGFVELVLVDDMSWDDYQGHMKWLLTKLNLYIDFVLSGQINEAPAYRNHPVKFRVHFNGTPPKAARITMRRIRDHLAQRNLALGITDSGKIDDEVNIDDWAEMP